MRRWLAGAMSGAEHLSAIIEFEKMAWFTTNGCSGAHAAAAQSASRGNLLHEIEKDKKYELIN
jgi:hypothetical protein